MHETHVVKTSQHSLRLEPNRARAVLLLGVYQPRVLAGWAKWLPEGVLDPKRYIWTLNGIEEAAAEDCKDSGFVSEPSSPLMC